MRFINTDGKSLFWMWGWRLWSWWKKRKVAKERGWFLNLGCGELLFPGNYLHLDVRPRAKGVVYHDVHSLSFLPNNHIEGIAAYDLFEHIGPMQAEDVLIEWIRVLEPGGYITLKVPDLGIQAALYIRGEWDAEKFSRQILGVWDCGKPGDKEFALGHKAAYDRKRLSTLLVKHGCVVKTMATFETPTTFNLVVVAEKR